MAKSGLTLLIAVLAFLAGTAVTLAQNVGPDEAVQARGDISQKQALTPAQERAIYNAVIGQRVRPSTTRIPVAIGAAVPQAVELEELPDQVAAETPWATVLKYAMVEDDIVVVDPIEMQVVDVIHDSAKR